MVPFNENHSMILFTGLFVFLLNGEVVVVEGKKEP